MSSIDTKFEFFFEIMCHSLTTYDTNNDADKSAYNKYGCKDYDVNNRGRFTRLLCRDVFFNIINYRGKRWDNGGWCRWDRCWCIWSWSRCGCIWRRRSWSRCRRSWSRSSGNFSNVTVKSKHALIEVDTDVVHSVERLTKYERLLGKSLVLDH